MSELEPHGKGRPNPQEPDVGESAGRQRSPGAAQESLALPVASAALPSQQARSRPRPGTRPKRFLLARSLNSSHVASSLGSPQSVDDDGDGIVTSMLLPSTTYAESLFSPLPPTPKPTVPDTNDIPKDDALRVGNVAPELAADTEERPAPTVSIHAGDSDARYPKAEVSSSGKSNSNKNRQGREVNAGREGVEEPKSTEQGTENGKNSDPAKVDDEDLAGQLARLQAANAMLSGENAQLHDLFNVMNGELGDLMLEDSELQELLAEDAAKSIAPSGAACQPRSGHQDGPEAGSGDEAESQYMDNQDPLGLLARLVHLVKQFSRIRKWQREQHKTEQSIIASIDEVESLGVLASPSLHRPSSYQSMQLQGVWQDLPEMMVQQTLSESANLTGLTLPDLLDSERALEAEGVAFMHSEEDVADEKQEQRDGPNDGAGNGSGSDDNGSDHSMSDAEMLEMHRSTRGHENDEGQDAVGRGDRTSAVRGKEGAGSAEKSKAERELQEIIERITVERDEAVGATEQVMVELDVALDEREKFSQENEQLRRLMGTLLEGRNADGATSLEGLWPLMEADEEDEEDEKDGRGESDRRTGHDEGGQVGTGDQQLQLPRTPKTPQTPRARESQQRRQQAFRDARALLQTPPPLKSPFPLRRIHTGYAARTWQRRRNAGVAGSALEVLRIVLHLATAQQWENVTAVGVWLAASSVGRQGPVKARGLWQGLCRYWQGESRRPGGHGRLESSTRVQQPDSPRLLPPQPAQKSPAPPQSSRRNIHALSLPLDSGPPLSPRFSPRPSPQRSARLSALLSSRLASSRLVFPTDAVAELLVSLLALGCLYIVVCTASERRLWLDHNADWPRTYLHHHLLQYRSDTGTSTRLSLADYDPLLQHPVTFSYQFCVCLPVPADPRFVTVPLATHAAYWRDWADDVVRWLLMP